MEYFVDKNSIVRKIWGKGDTVLFIFAGSAAEFALNKAVDWLYFTGNLPADPLKRLFSTVTYAKQIVYLSQQEALNAIDKIAAIHSGIERSRGTTIPDWAYRDVLFMLIYYSIASFELMERKLTDDEKEDVYNVFFRIGTRMGLKELPNNYKDWLKARGEHLEEDLLKSNFTVDLYKQYKKHLGIVRYHILLQAQQLIAPERVKNLLNLRNILWFTVLLSIYKFSRKVNMDCLIKSIILPAEYKDQIKALDE
jgi:hypothetical protein